MKITRFINGKKVHGAFSENIVVENELITGTIERINARMRRKPSHKENKADLDG